MKFHDTHEDSVSVHKNSYQMKCIIWNYVTEITRGVGIRPMNKSIIQWNNELKTQLKWLVRLIDIHLIDDLKHNRESSSEKGMVNKVYNNNSTLSAWARIILRFSIHPLEFIIFTYHFLHLSYTT